MKPARKTYPPIHASVAELKAAIEEQLANDPELLIEDDAPADLEGPAWNAWMNTQADTMLEILNPPRQRRKDGTRCGAAQVQPPSTRKNEGTVFACAVE